MGGNPPGQLQKGLEPFQLAPAEKLHMHPGIGSADDGANSDGDDVHQFVASGAFHPGVVQISEMIQDRYMMRFRHGPLPSLVLSNRATLS